jgi:hypothetical protein
MVAVLGAIVLATQLSATSYTDVRDALRTQGARVDEDGLGTQPFLGGTDHCLRVNGVGVDVFEYRTTLGASLDAQRISADGSTIGPAFGPFGGAAATIDFVALPHWYHAGRVLALYVGRDDITLALLGSALGAPFAEG